MNKYKCSECGFVFDPDSAYLKNPHTYMIGDEVFRDADVCCPRCHSDCWSEVEYQPCEECCHEWPEYELIETEYGWICPDCFQRLVGD